MKDVLMGKEIEVLECFDTGTITPTRLARKLGVAGSSMREFLQKNGRCTSRVFIYECNLSATDAAYIAGIIDGEGCVFARKVTSRNTVGVQGGINVTSTSPELLKELQSLTMLGLVGIARDTREKPKWKTAWRWDIGQQAAAVLLRQITPYIRLKKTQAELLMELAELKQKSTTQNQFNIQRQFEIVEIMQRLNKRGKVIDEAE